jgi:hypothetical protein
LRRFRRGYIHFFTFNKEAELVGEQTAPLKITMSLVFEPPKNLYDNVNLDKPLVRYDCGHESKDKTIVEKIYHQIGLGLEIGFCPSCENKKSTEDRIVQSVAAALQDGLRPLSGDKAQVESAETIRASLLEVFQKQSLLIQDQAFTDEERFDAQEVLDAVHSEISEQTDASWWISAKHRDKPKQFFVTLCDGVLGRLREIEGRESTRFDVTSCGHKNDHYPLGPIQKKLCASCQLATNERIKAREQAARFIPTSDPSVLAQIKAGLPTLEGSEKQVVWAGGIRDKFLRVVVQMEKRGDPSLVVRQVCREALSRHNAKWWIDRKHRDNPDALFLDLKLFLETGANIPRADGLPELEGSEKQVAWAERIRSDFMDELDQQEKAETNEARKKALAKVRKDVEGNTNAGEWIAWYQDPADNINGSVRYYMENNL